MQSKSRTQRTSKNISRAEKLRMTNDDRPLIYKARLDSFTFDYTSSPMAHVRATIYIPLL